MEMSNYSLATHIDTCGNPKKNQPYESTQRIQSCLIVWTFSLFLHCLLKKKIMKKNLIDNFYTFF